MGRGEGRRKPRNYVGTDAGEKNEDKIILQK